MENNKRGVHLTDQFHPREVFNSTKIGDNELINNKRRLGYSH